MLFVNFEEMQQKLHVCLSTHRKDFCLNLLLIFGLYIEYGNSIAQNIGIGFVPVVILTLFISNGAIS